MRRRLAERQKISSKILYTKGQTKKTPGAGSSATVFNAEASEVFIPIEKLSEVKGDVKIVMPESDGAIILNYAAVNSLLEQANARSAVGIKAVIILKNKEELSKSDNLSDDLKKALLDERVRKVYEISLYFVDKDGNETEPEDGVGGQLTIHLPYEPGAGEVFYLPEDGDPVPP
jgi:hypothetical protein